MILNRLNSLKIKIIGAISIILIAIIAIASWFNYSRQKAMFTDIARQNSIIVIESILSSIQTSMKLGHSKEVDNILGRLKPDSQIKTLRIVNVDGKILHSINPNQIGKFLTPDERKGISTATSDSFTVDSEENIFDTYTKIKNGAECFGCHPSNISTIAFLEAELSLDNFVKYVEKEQKSYIAATLLTILLVVATTIFFLSYYIDRPIRKMIKAMDRVEKGDFNYIPAIKSSNEMHLLSTHFADMTLKLKDLIDTKIKNEKRIALTEEKLIHHNEIEQMNIKLEEQLKEIENLNISLEERIEEIEEANFKIADMASELEQKNVTLKLAVDRLSTINKISLSINSTIDIDRLFNQIVIAVTKALKASIGYIIMYDAKTEMLKVTNLTGYGKLLNPGKSIHLQATGVSAFVIKNKKSLLIKNIDETEFDKFSDLGFERKTLISVPLMINNEIIGTMNVVNREEDSSFDSDDLDMLTTIAAEASIAIKNATLYDEQQQTYLNTIQALVSAIEASDSYTRGHSERVTRYSLELGRSMDLDSERLQVLERAAILHDIGKIGVDLSLLHKEGRLTPDDIRELQKHPLIGVHILEPIDFLKDVRVCIAQHHERYDGHGYPNRIKGDVLALESRILTVADAFDAMTTDRPYRKGLSLEAAIEELELNAGTQFDPEIVALFISLIEEGAFSSTSSYFPHLPPFALKSVA